MKPTETKESKDIETNVEEGKTPKLFQVYYLLCDFILCGEQYKLYLFTVSSLLNETSWKDWKIFIVITRP